MDENKNPQTQPEAAQDPGKPAERKAQGRAAALYDDPVFRRLCAGADLADFADAFLGGEDLRAECPPAPARSPTPRRCRRKTAAWQDEKIALEQENKELQAKLDELNEKLDAASQAEEDAAAAENEMIKSLRTELDRTKEAYEALLEAKSCDTREGNVTFSRAMQTLERLKDYLGPTALEEYQTLGGE